MDERVQFVARRLAGESRKAIENRKKLGPSPQSVTGNCAPDGGTKKRRMKASAFRRSAPPFSVGITSLSALKMIRACPSDVRCS